jgi:preprotein translocase SecE subunit
MATKEDMKPEQDKAVGPEGAEQVEPRPEPSEPSEPGEPSPETSTAIEPEAREEEGAGAYEAPQQLGTKRFVYAAYFAGAIGIAFISSKVLAFAWFKLQTLKPALGEPRDEIVMPLSALIGGLAAVYYWVRTRARELAEEVATEMSKVTWPDRTEVTNGTFVVIVTTIVSTVFFALMDRFWGFVSNLVYGGT